MDQEPVAYPMDAVVRWPSVADSCCYPSTSNELDGKRGDQRFTEDVLRDCASPIVTCLIVTAACGGDGAEGHTEALREDVSCPGSLGS